VHRTAAAVSDCVKDGPVPPRPVTYLFGGRGCRGIGMFAWLIPAAFVVGAPALKDRPRPDWPLTGEWRIERAEHESLARRHLGGDRVPVRWAQDWFSTALVEFLAHDSLRRVLSPAERLSYAIDRLRRENVLLEMQIEELLRTIEKLQRKKKDNGGRD